MIEPGWLDGPQARYAGVALFMFGFAWAAIRWVGRLLRDQLGPGMDRTREPFLPVTLDGVPPALLKEALERGLVTPSQLARMTPMERQFVFASFRTALSSGGPAADVPSGANLQTAQTGPPAPHTPAAGAPLALDGAEFGMAAVPGNDTLRIWCPFCGTALRLPAFAPLVARCDHCGAKTAVRDEEEGRYVLHVTPKPTDD